MEGFFFSTLIYDANRFLNYTCSSQCHSEHTIQLNFGGECKISQHKMNWSTLIGQLVGHYLFDFILTSHNYIHKIGIRVFFFYFPKLICDFQTQI